VKVVSQDTRAFRNPALTTTKMTERPEVTVAILNYNGRGYLADTIGSIRDLEYPVKEVLMVDDGSQDGSVEFVRRHYPEIRIIEMGENTKMLNRFRNKAIAAADTDLVLITDNDIAFVTNCLTILVTAEASRCGRAYSPRHV
jgi:glycosyltransferase involved in cell wall biosynthesis